MRAKISVWRVIEKKLKDIRDSCLKAYVTREFVRETGSQSPFATLTQETYEYRY